MEQRSGIERREGWGGKCSNCDSIQETSKGKLSDMKTVFYFCAVIAIGFAGWIGIDHIGLGNKVTANTEIIKYTVENQKIMNENISKILWSMNLRPEALPPKPEKTK